MKVFPLAFLYGVAAFIAGAPTTSNPYDAGTKSFDLWRAGWFTDHSPWDHRDAIAASFTMDKAA